MLKLLLAHCSPKLVCQTINKYMLKSALKQIWDLASPHLSGVMRFVKQRFMAVVHMIMMERGVAVVKQGKAVVQLGTELHEREISRVAAQVCSAMKVMEIEAQTESRYKFKKELGVISHECESNLRREAKEFKEVYMKFVEDQAAHRGATKAILSEFEARQQEIVTRFEKKSHLHQHGKSACNLNDVSCEWSSFVVFLSHLSSLSKPHPDHFPFLLRPPNPPL